MVKQVSKKANSMRSGPACSADTSGGCLSVSFMLTNFTRVPTALLLVLVPLPEPYARSQRCYLCRCSWIYWSVAGLTTTSTHIQLRAEWKKSRLHELLNNRRKRNRFRNAWIWIWVNSCLFLWDHAYHQQTYPSREFNNKNYFKPNTLNCYHRWI